MPTETMLTPTGRNLSVDLRPNRFSEMIGQTQLLNEIRSLFATRIPLGVMLVGDPGAGKTTIARIIALSLQCTHAPFGEPCDECISNEETFEIDERNCAHLNKTEDAKDLLPDLMYLPRFGRYRVHILDEAQQLTPAAQNVLLKPFEDNTAYNVFIIGTSNPAKIIDAVKRRFVVLAVQGQNKDGVARLARSTATAAGVPDHPRIEELVTELHKADITSSGLIVMAVEKLLAGAKPSDAVLVKDASLVDYHRLCSAAGQGDWDTCRKLLEVAVPADADVIKMRLSWFFRKKLLEAPMGVRADLLIQFIHQLADHSVYETGLQLSATIATVAKICQTVQRAKTQSAKPTGGNVPETSATAVRSASIQ